MSAVTHKSQNRKRRNMRLLELMVNEGLTPNILAYRAGVSGQTVREALKGQTPSPPVQYAIAQVFNRRPLDIWSLEEQRR